MKPRFQILVAALGAIAGFAGSSLRADTMASIAIAPATGAVSLLPHWATGGNLSGFHFMAQDLSLGGGANQFYSLKGTAIPIGGDVTAFTHYIAASGAPTAHADIGSKLTPNSYSALTSADPDLGYGSVNLYTIHHTGAGDYLTAIIPSSGTASAVTDEKPMSGPGGTASGYFGLTFAAANLGYGLNSFYYLRNDPVTHTTKFGSLVPALAGASSDLFDLGIGGHNSLVYSGADVGFGVSKMYYLRLDPITGFTIFGMLDPGTGKSSDVANLGSVYSAMTFVPGDLTLGGGNQFYTTGTINPTWQSVSFAAIADRTISSGSFTVTPSASSSLPITLTVVPGSVGAASISGPVAGVYTVTPVAPGLITLQATQAGATAPVAYEYNMLRQSFTATGVALLAFTAQPASQTAVAGGTATFSAAASGLTTPTYQWRKAGANITGNASATTATLTLTNVQAIDAASYDLVATNSSGSLISNAVALTLVTASPVITNSALTSGATVGTAYSYTITASGSPTSFSASPLPAGLALNSSTGVISGTPTAAANTTVLLGATNTTGTGNATLSIVVAAAGVAPIITNSPTNAPATAGAPFVTYQIGATGVPTSYTATGLPAGLTLNPLTGAINGTPTTAGAYVVTLTATNSTGTSTISLTITVAGAPSSRIVNFSARAVSGPGSQALIMGFVTSGDGKNLLIRGIGPTLTKYGVVNVLADPLLTLYGTNNTPVAMNDDWQLNVAIDATSLPSNAALISSISAQFGAFPLSSGSKDSAMLFMVNSGAHTTGLVRPVSTTGIALTEVYDVDSVTASTSRLINVAARMNVGLGESALSAGFVIAGNAPKNVLIRGVGPSLAAFGVGGVLADPQIAVFSGTTQIASDDNWETGASTAAQITTISAQVGAFPLPSGSKDAALLLTLQPGIYTVQVTGAGNTTGVALVEIYETP